MKRKLQPPTVLIKSAQGVLLNPTEVATILAKQTTAINYLLDRVAALEGAGTPEERNELKDLFFNRYRMKAKQITGSDSHEDGRMKWPMWSGKEGTLFKGDMERYGPATMRKFIELFFSDVVEEVSAFTRYKDRAGYSYSVFHGVLEKLQMAKRKPILPCEACGAWGSHYLDCSIGRQQRDQLQQEIKEIQEQRMEPDEADAMFGGLKKNLRGGRNGTKHKRSGDIWESDEGRGAEAASQW